MSRTPLWTPSPERAARTAMHAFRRVASERSGRDFATTAALHRWSVADPATFWALVWERCGIEGERGARVLAPEPASLRRARWFPDARLSFAANLLAGPDGDEALVAYREGREDAPPVRLTRAELRAEVGRYAAALAAAGVGPGTCVGAWLGNGVEAVAAMLATASLGALWASCGSDFGPESVLDRLAPLAPRVVLALDGYRYRGKALDSRPALARVAAALPPPCQVVVVPWLGETAGLPPGAVPLERFLPASAPPPPATAWPFEQPLYALFSSGTTGKPKCMLHGAGNVLLQHAKEHRLHCDVRPGDRVFFHTTCGWMMWNWLVSALAARATVVLLDGDPLQPADRLFALAAEERLTFLGSSARSFDAMRRAALPPPGLAALRTVASTGSPLVPETHAWLQRTLGDVHAASISGGTDIVSCFALGDPTAPVRAGELQTPGLGMDVDVLDPEGRPLRGAPGELVCRPPFPSMPLAFHDDPGDERYRRAYFERFPGTWRHGDWAEWTAEGGLVIHGRSDATLNANGVRIGTAELYRELERFPEVLEACAVEHHRGDDEGIALLVRLAPDATAADPAALFARIRAALRANRSPRHVPRWMAAVPDLPRTKSGKLSELAVRDALRGRPAENRLALANPECLDALAVLELR